MPLRRWGFESTSMALKGAEEDEGSSSHLDRSNMAMVFFFLVGDVLVFRKIRSVRGSGVLRVGRMRRALRDGVYSIDDEELRRPG